MKKIIYLARKLKAFTFDEIFMLAEIPKEELSSMLEQLISENVLKEDGEKYYTNYNIGDIVFVKEYKYSDVKKGNNHFFVIIDKDNTAVPIENFGMIISSNLEKLKFKSNKLLEKDTLNNLKKNSIVKTDVVYKILNEQIIFKIGTVDSEKIEEYKNSFYESLQGEN